MVVPPMCFTHGLSFVLGKNFGGGAKLHVPAVADRISGAGNMERFIGSFGGFIGVLIGGYRGYRSL